MRRIKAELVSRPRMQFAAMRAHGILSQFRGIVASIWGEALSSEEKILIIVGAGRSGNTLTRKLLMQHGDIYIPPESYVWGEILNSYIKGAALSWAERVELSLAKLEFHPEFVTFGVGSLTEFCAEAREWPLHARTPGNLIAGLYRWLATKKGIEPQWIGDKTPANLMRIGFVSAMFPNARYIYLLRDGVAVAHSYKACGLASDLETGALRWRNSQLAWRQFSAGIPEARKYQLRFEDLMASPTVAIEHVLRKFEIPLLRAPRDVSHILGDVAIREHHQKVSNDRVDSAAPKDRPPLTRRERTQLQSIFGDSLAAAGYPGI